MEKKIVHFRASDELRDKIEAYRQKNGLANTTQAITKSLEKFYKMKKEDK